MFLQHFVPSWKKCPLLVEMVVRLKNNINNATRTKFGLNKFVRKCFFFDIWLVQKNSLLSFSRFVHFLFKSEVLVFVRKHCFELFVRMFGLTSTGLRLASFGRFPAPVFRRWTEFREPGPAAASPSPSKCRAGAWTWNRGLWKFIILEHSRCTEPLSKYHSQIECGITSYHMSQIPLTIPFNNLKQRFQRRLMPVLLNIIDAVVVES